MYRWLALLSAGAGLLAACGETPLDVISSVPNGGGGGLDAGGLGDAALEAEAPCGPVPTPVAGRYRVQQASSLRCLRGGAPTLLMGNPGYLTELDESCAGDDIALWDLLPVAPNRFQLRNVGVDMNLDIQFADTASGTPAVLYTATMLRNQQFIFQPLGSSRFALAAAHAFFQCLAERSPSPEIWPCDDGDPTQMWQLVSASCP